jgi:hypothetical protein
VLVPDPRVQGAGDPALSIEAEVAVMLVEDRSDGRCRPSGNIDHRIGGCHMTVFAVA